MSDGRRGAIALTVGDPAGIGPDIIAKLAETPLTRQFVCIGDPRVIADRAALLGIPLSIKETDLVDDAGAIAAGDLRVCPVTAPEAVVAGRAEPGNAGFVIECIERAVRGCREGRYRAMTTAPVNKAVINNAGIAFTGHTEFIAERAGGALPVMMLVGGGLKVALATTHMALREVPDRIERKRLGAILATLDAALTQQFRVAAPRIAVCGLNPHAGEGGHLGTEDARTIAPAVADARRAGVDAQGPIPADTAFSPDNRERFDAYLAMYHDQGLPVIKALGFGDIVNVTLGLPLVRTSVDHGTAYELAGTGAARSGSLRAAIELADVLARTE
jgi:4-hydroxythreonine-4-phosphate dehydrogenase